MSIVTIKSSTAIKCMQEGGKILSGALNKVSKSIRPGISTNELNIIAESYIISNSAIPSFLGYEGFPAAACISVNEQLIHGIPSSNTILKEGDIVSVDLGVFFKGYHTDAARTYPVGKITEPLQKLIDVTKQSFYEGISKAKVGNRIYDISNAIQTYVENLGYTLNVQYTGHGVGHKLHESPDIPNVGIAGHGIRIENGMTLAVEPMVNMGNREVYVLDNDWTVVTRDGMPCAHYEETIAIVDGQALILTGDET